MHFEVEQKYRVAIRESVVRRLHELATAVDAPVRQVDTYFAHPSRDFAATDEALRIRRVGDHNVMTYKGPKLDATTKTRREIELAIGDGEAGARLGVQLLQSLGFGRVAEVAKSRTVFQLARDGRPIEIASDEVDDLGSFVELEIVVDDEAELDVAREQITMLAAELELADVERRGYLELLLEQAGN